MKKKIREQLIALIGQEVTIYIDRPIGTRHPKYKDIVYPINYGYIKDISDIYNLNNDNILEIINNATIEKFNGKDNILESVIIKENEKLKELKTKACFIFIGYEPATNFLKNLEILDEKGYIIVDNQKRTPIKGIYAAGDVVEKDAYQIVTAVSDGALAIVSCIKDMKEV